MNFEELLTTVIFAAGVLVIISAALLIWAAILLLRIQDIERRIRPIRPRDGAGRLLRERL